MRSRPPPPSPPNAAPRPSSPAQASDDPDGHLLRRRVLLPLALGAWAPWGLLTACGGSGNESSTNGGVLGVGAPPVPQPAPPPSAPAPVSSALTRLKAALQKPRLAGPSTPLTVTQARGASAGAPTLGATALVLPTPRGFAINPNPESLADIPQLWGHMRAQWTRQRAGLIGTSAANQSWFVPISRDHLADGQGSQGVCGLHFELNGREFELLCAGTDAQITLIADGQYLSPKVITTAWAGGVAGAALREPNAYIRFDMGSRAQRKLSLYARSSQGPCAIAINGADAISAWDRSAEPSIAVMCDSYGGAPSPNWGVSGPFWEAAAQLGIVHLDVDAIGGTGYAPNNANELTRKPGNAFSARLNSNVVTLPDLFLTCGGINDNNSITAPPLYASAAQARAGFETGVNEYYTRLRNALPQAVLAATGPWAPKQVVQGDAVARSKLDTIRAALQAAGGLWVLMDNLNGGWSNSAGASGGSADGPWQTGSGHAGAPTGSGNGDRHISNDGVHPTAEGSLYLGTRIATDLRAAIAAL